MRSFVNADIPITSTQQAVEENLNTASSSTDAQDGLALYKLGTLYHYGRGIKTDLAAAKEYYEKAEKAGKPCSAAKTWNRLGNAFYKEKKYTEAKACYEKALSADAQYGFALCNLGFLYHCGKGVIQNLETAEEYYEKAEKAKKPYNSAEKWNNLGVKFSKEKKYPEAKAYYEKALSTDAQYGSALYNLGTLYHYGEGVETDLTKAKEYYEKAEKAEKPRSFAEDWNRLGVKFSKEKKYPEAKACYEKALSADAQYGSALRNLGFLYHYGAGVEKDLDKAKEYYEKAGKAEKPCSFAEDWNGLGNTFCKEKKYPEAKACYEKALSTDAQYGVALRNLGTLYVETDLARAKEYYEKAEKVGKPYYSPARVWDRLGNALYKEEKYSEAKACYEKALSTDAQYGVALYTLGLLHHYGQGVEKDLAQAKEYYEKAEKAEKPYSSAKAWNRLGNAFHKEEKYTEAKACYERALSKDAQYGWALYNLSNLYRCGKGVETDRAKAKEYYKKAKVAGNLYGCSGLDKTIASEEMWEKIAMGLILGAGGVAVAPIIGSIVTLGAGAGVVGWTRYSMGFSFLVGFVKGYTGENVLGEIDMERLESAAEHHSEFVGRMMNRNAIFQQQQRQRQQRHDYNNRINARISRSYRGW